MPPKKTFDLCFFRAGVESPPKPMAGNPLDSPTGKNNLKNCCAITGILLETTDFF
jgi:hypothetical protein